MDNSVKITLIIVSSIVIIALIGGGIFYNFMSSYKPIGQTVSVSGQSDIKAIPDKVDVYFNVETNGTTSAEATTSNAEIVDKLKSNLAFKGIRDDQIITQGFSVNPEYDWANGRQNQIGYSATHAIKIELSTNDSSKIGDVIDAGASAGAAISYINFELSLQKQNDYKAQAMKAAAEDARIKAESMASGLDKTLGDLVSVSNSDYGYSPWNLYSASAGIADSTNIEMAKQASTDIQPGEKDITASVSVVYRIK